jgi:hypothetical protein
MQAIFKIDPKSSLHKLAPVTKIRYVCGTSTLSVTFYSLETKSVIKFFRYEVAAIIILGKANI